jgi:acyl-coenzyme A thioesterase PaaI-like protein
MKAETIPAPDEVKMRDMCRKEHRNSFSCRSVEKGGLGIEFHVAADGSITAVWKCPATYESYEGIIHGGLLATVLDSSMVHALFARGIVAKTGELTIRYRNSVRIDAPVSVSARLHDAHPPLYYMQASISQNGRLCVEAKAKFMAIK